MANTAPCHLCLAKTLLSTQNIKLLLFVALYILVNLRTVALSVAVFHDGHFYDHLLPSGQVSTTADGPAR